MRRLIVQKYGGTSVANPERIKRVARRVIDARRKGWKVVVVVSALGNTTDELIALAHQITPTPSDREMDMLISTGEQVSIALLAMAIHELGEEAISFTGAQVGILTDYRHTRARIIRADASRIERELRKGKIVIVAGFQGVTKSNEITTLGRGGSNMTAVALASSLRAAVCEMCTDVAGVFTADPRLVPGAKKIDKISYEEMLEIASLGAQVLQPEAVEFAERYDVTIHVRSSFGKAPGTIISREVRSMEHVPVQSVAVTKNEAKITICDVPDQPGVAAKIFTEIARKSVNVDMIIQNVSRTGFTDISFTVIAGDLKKTLAIAEEVGRAVKAGRVIADEDIAKISVVGIGMRIHSGVAARMFEALAKKGINIETISTSEIKISCLVRKKFAEEAVRAIHREFELGRKSG